MAPAPPEVAAIGGRVAVQELQVGGQGGRRREVIHVDEGIGGHEALVSGMVGAQHDLHGPGQEGVAPELLGDIIQVLRVLEGQVELVEGHRVHELRVGQRLPGPGLAKHVHPHELTQLAVVAHARLALVPVAHHPGHQALLPGQRGDQPWRLLAGMGPGVEVAVRHEDVRVGPVGERPVEDVTCQTLQPRGVGGRLEVHPHPALARGPGAQGGQGFGLSRLPLVVHHQHFLLLRRGHLDAPGRGPVRGSLHQVSVVEEHRLGLPVGRAIRVQDAAADVEAPLAVGGRPAGVVSAPEGLPPQQHVHQPRRARGGPAGWAAGCAGTAPPAAVGLSGFGFLRGEASGVAEL